MEGDQYKHQGEKEYYYAPTPNNSDDDQTSPSSSSQLQPTSAPVYPIDGYLPDIEHLNQVYSPDNIDQSIPVVEQQTTIQHPVYDSYKEHDIETPLPPQQYIETTTSATTLDAYDPSIFEEPLASKAERALIVSVVTSALLLFICPWFACCPSLMFMKKFRDTEDKKVKRFVNMSRVMCVAITIIALLAIAIIMTPSIVGIVYGGIHKNNQY
jgi:hypothetical protein